MLNHSFFNRNSTATFDLGRPIDLIELAMQLSNADYQIRGFAAVSLRIPGAVGRVFSSGKLTVLGAKSINGAKEAGRKLARMVQLAGNPDVLLLFFIIEFLFYQ